MFRSWLRGSPQSCLVLAPHGLRLGEELGHAVRSLKPDHIICEVDIVTMQAAPLRQMILGKRLDGKKKIILLWNVELADKDRHQPFLRTLFPLTHFIAFVLNDEIWSPWIAICKQGIMIKISVPPPNESQKRLCLEHQVGKEVLEQQDPNHLSKLIGSIHNYQEVDVLQDILSSTSNQLPLCSVDRQKHTDLFGCISWLQQCVTSHQWDEVENALDLHGPRIITALQANPPEYSKNRMQHSAHWYQTFSEWDALGPEWQDKLAPLYVANISWSRTNPLPNRNVGSAVAQRPVKCKVAIPSRPPQSSGQRAKLMAQLLGPSITPWEVIQTMHLGMGSQLQSIFVVDPLIQQNLVDQLKEDMEKAKKLLTYSSSKRKMEETIL